MIAYAGYLRLQHGHQESLSIEVRPRWPMSELNESELNESELNESELNESELNESELNEHQTK